MKLVTWNINGIRATKHPIKYVLDSLQCDIICLQETKITRDVMEGDIAIVDGYSSYYSFSQAKQGYSGVATYCRQEFTPIKAQEGLFHFSENPTGGGAIKCYGNLHSMFSKQRMIELDREGRTIITQYEYINEDKKPKYLTIINVYCPRADPEKPERRDYKMDFYKALEERSNAILLSGSSVIICGDLNTSHRRIDHCNPDDPELFYDNSCRVWMDQIMYNKGDYSTLKKNWKCGNNERDGFVDTFRYFFPNRREAFTCWCTLKGCRQTNYGTRIDYILADSAFHKESVVNADIFPEIEGSDHCPVKCEMTCCVVAAKKCPPCCTQYMPEFGGRQPKLQHFFVRPSEKAGPNEINCLSDSKFQTCNTLTKTKKRKLETKNTNKISTLCKQTKLSHFIVKQNSTNKSNLEKSTKSSINNDVFANKKNDRVKSSASVFWKSILSGPDPAPLCKGHSEPCVMRTVKKEGSNFGKNFYCCNRPEGHKTNAEARCSFFEWKK